MNKTDDSKLDLLELGSVTGDTQGPGGVALEGFIYMPDKPGITAD